MFNVLISSLQTALQQPLPGLDAQMEMAPPQRGRPSLEWVMAQNPRRAAVLAFLYPIAAEAHVALIQRTSYPGVHSDQISFPGGQLEGGDQNLTEAALREAEEEVGLMRSKVQLLGPMSELYIPPSNFLVQPYLGFGSERPVFIPQPREVKEILEIPLRFFQDGNNLSVTRFALKGQNFETPCYVYKERIIWGATAMMLRELEVLVRPYYSALGR
jgi:8-oxo-dGTP pyrophosphatase MutT (NUDIX family)